MGQEQKKKSFVRKTAGKTGGFIKKEILSYKRYWMFDSSIITDTYKENKELLNDIKELREVALNSENNFIYGSTPDELKSRHKVVLTFSIITLLAFLACLFSSQYMFLTGEHFKAIALFFSSFNIAMVYMYLKWQEYCLRHFFIFNILTYSNLMRKSLSELLPFSTFDELDSNAQKYILKFIAKHEEPNNNK